MSESVLLLSLIVAGVAGLLAGALLVNRPTFPFPRYKVSNPIYWKRLWLLARADGRKGYTAFTPPGGP